METMDSSLVTVTGCVFTLNPSFCIYWGSKRASCLFVLLYVLLYVLLLVKAFQADTIPGYRCRTLLSIDSMPASCHHLLEKDSCVKLLVLPLQAGCSAGCSGTAFAHIWAALLLKVLVS
jgi:hypothetical protein